MNQGKIYAALGAVVVIAVLFFGVQYIKSNLNRHTEVANAAPTNLYAPVQCTSSMLESSYSIGNVAVGSPEEFSIILHNTSTAHPCTINVGSDNLKVRITTGGVQVAQLDQCEWMGKEKILLIDRGKTATYKLTWDGATAPEGCGSAENKATAGTYYAEFSFADGSAAPGQDGFTLY